MSNNNVTKYCVLLLFKCDATSVCGTWRRLNSGQFCKRKVAGRSSIIKLFVFLVFRGAVCGWWVCDEKINFGASGLSGIRACCWWALPAAHI